MLKYYLADFPTGGSLLFDRDIERRSILYNGSDRLLDQSDGGKGLILYLSPEAPALSALISCTICSDTIAI